MRRLKPPVVVLLIPTSLPIPLVANACPELFDRPVLPLLAQPASCLGIASIRYVVTLSGFDVQLDRRTPAARLGGLDHTARELYGAVGADAMICTADDDPDAAIEQPGCKGVCSDRASALIIRHLEEFTQYEQIRHRRERCDMAYTAFRRGEMKRHKSAARSTENRNLGGIRIAFADQIIEHLACAADSVGDDILPVIQSIPPRMEGGGFTGTMIGAMARQVDRYI